MVCLQPDTKEQATLDPLLRKRVLPEIETTGGNPPSGVAVKDFTSLSMATPSVQGLTGSQNAGPGGQKSAVMTAAAAAAAIASAASAVLSATNDFGDNPVPGPAKSKSS